MPVYLALLTALVFPTDVRPLTVARSFVRRWWVWAAYLIPCALYLWNYFANHYYDPTLSHPSPRAFLTYQRVAWQEFVSLFFNVAFVPQNTRIHTLTTVVTQLVVVALIVVSVIRSRSAWRVWAFFFFAFALNTAAVGWGRVGIYGPAVGHDPRYLIENASLFTLSLGFAFLPHPLWAPERAAPQEPRAHRWGAWMRRRAMRAWLATALALICCAQVGLFLVSAEWLFRASAPR